MKVERPGDFPGGSHGGRELADADRDTPYERLIADTAFDDINGSGSSDEDILDRTHDELKQCAVSLQTSPLMEGASDFGMMEA